MQAGRPFSFGPASAPLVAKCRNVPFPDALTLQQRFGATGGDEQMNADERSSGQQGYGQQSPQQSQSQDQQTGRQNPDQQISGQQQGQQASAEQGGSMASGQASYGNSGDTGTLSQNSSDLGQQSDMGQSGQQQDSGLFSGSEDDMGSSGDQNFADQGQGALNEDRMGSDEGTTDIEIERSQGRESDIEGSSL